MALCGLLSHLCPYPSTAAFFYNSTPFCITSTLNGIGKVSRSSLSELESRNLSSSRLKTFLALNMTINVSPRSKIITESTCSTPRRSWGSCHKRSAMSRLECSIAKRSRKNKKGGGGKGFGNDGDMSEGSSDAFNGFNGSGGYGGHSNGGGGGYSSNSDDEFLNWFFYDGIWLWQLLCCWTFMQALYFVIKGARKLLERTVLTAV